MASLPNPCDNAPFWSYLFFTWPGAMMSLGAEKTLQSADLPSISKHDESRSMGKRLSKNWQEEQSKGHAHASLGWALVRTFWKVHWYHGILLLTESFARIYQAVILGKLIKYFLGEYDNSTLYTENGYYLSFQLTALGLYVMMCHHHVFFMAWRLGLQLRIALTSMLYDKSIKLSLRSVSQLNVGHVVNLSAQDSRFYLLV